MICLVLPVPPASNRYWRMWQGRMVTSNEARTYKAHVRLALMAERLRPLTGDLHVTVRWYRKARMGDLDGRLKVALDALQGLAYQNDKQVTRILAERFEDPLNPRLEVEIHAA